MMRSPFIRYVVTVSLAMTLFAGCVTEDSAKTSLFEDDHEVAPHWPDGLEDAAAKIRQRLDASKSSPAEAKQQADEIVDLVSWVPEIAADTNLPEPDWIPLDNAAESLSANLRAANHELTDANRLQTTALCELIEQSLPKIPDQLPKWKGSTP
ncbi:hypothetical protein [Neorhodopirellula pilleata]|uniref:Uncharacterized protein n=1 Tax=Neorhodopirellula pilleata TaxID=2714738 RepID=A0A5C6A569_9BACT|nr:hypothetical protein [Neorhodopirellula pilleata]TWT93533.1 hypothetical protein Pla100_40510 [Neorhodopirellula pilleata]